MIFFFYIIKLGQNLYIYSLFLHNNIIYNCLNLTLTLTKSQIIEIQINTNRMLQINFSFFIEFSHCMILTDCMIIFMIIQKLKFLDWSNSINNN